MKFRLYLLALLTSACCVTAHAQTDTLSDDVKNALEEITQNDVMATVSFLASDELGGRDTPSPGLRVASAYIASRFHAAGLKGGVKIGTGGESYYQIHEIDTTTVARDGIIATQNGNPITHYGLLSAKAEVVKFSGKPTFVSHEDEWRSMKFDGPVCFTPAPITNPRDQFNLRQQLARLTRNGATAILLQVEEDNPMIGEARKALEPQMVSARRGSRGTILLVSPLAKDAEIQLNLPAQKSGKAQVRNVIGVLPGSDPELSEEAIIITAHLDHVGQTAGLPDPVFNGADDDASGCTAVCELADAFGALETAPKRTVIFMTFWGEEKGLLGSKHYAENPEWPLDKTVANINIEMIGRPEPGAHEKAWMTGWFQSDLGILMDKAARKANFQVFEHPKFSEMLYRASDNASFVAKGVIAHSFSAGSLHDDYHQPGDEWVKLNLRHMTKVIQGLFVASLPLANGEVTPKKTSKK